jgi:lipopolysaccharide export system permease protein
VIYTEAVDSASDRLQHVLIADERESTQQNNIFAREARMISDPDAETVTLRLRDGSIHTTDARDGAEYQTDFESYDVSLDLRQVFAGAKGREDDPKALTLGQLRAAIAAKQAKGLPAGSDLVEYHRKFSIPFACVVFGLVAVPLGIQPARSARSRGFAVSLAMIFIYYVLLSAGQAMAKQRLVAPSVGLWLPNLVFVILGSYLFARAARERTVLQLERTQHAIGRLRDRIAARLGVAPS